MSRAPARRAPRLRRFGRDASGAALVEFALVMPVLLVFLGAAVEGGRIAWIHQAAAGGVRDAARMIARIAPADPCPGAAIEAHADLAGDLVRASFDAAIDPGRAAITSVEVAARCVGGADLAGPVALVEVRAELRVELIFGAVFGLVGAPLGPFAPTVADTARIYGL